MAHQNPLGKIRSVAIGAWKDPRSTAGAVAAQARGTVALGKVVVGQVSHKIQERRGHATPPAPRAPAPEETAPPTAEAKVEPVVETKSRAETVPNPARIAPNVAKQTPEQKAVQEAATPRRAPVKKAAPGAKLPPRKPTGGE